MHNLNLLRDLIRVLDRNIGMLERNELSCCNLTISQCRIILEIGIVEEISLIDLTNLLSVDKSTMSRNIDKLVNAGLVDRIIDPENRRYVKIGLTMQGRVAFNQINSIFENYYTNILKSIPVDKRNQVEESLKLLIDSLEKNICC